MNTTKAPDLLLVEDNPHDLELALRAIRQTGIANSIQVARDGVEALDFVFGEGEHAGRDVADRPGLILLDLKLPKVDGFQVLRRLKGDARTRMIPVVILTTCDQQRDVIESYDLGVNSFIVKPVNFEQFVDAVRTLGLYWLLLNRPPHDRRGA